jgi:hypothetical protein
MSRTSPRSLHPRPTRVTAGCAPAGTLRDVLQELERAVSQMEDEELAILAWRMTVLDRAGYDEEDLVLLACTKDVDLHLAVQLLEQGCPPATAVRILL